MSDCNQRIRVERERSRRPMFRKRNKSDVDDQRISSFDEIIAVFTLLQDIGVSCTVLFSVKQLCDYAHVTRGV